VHRDEEEIHAYGHIVVDETQDLSPMQLRMLSRRSLAGSMTLVGDIAQATGPLAPESWDEIVRYLSPKRPPHLVELTVSYRTPAEVIEVSKEVLAAADVGLQAPTPVRRSGSRPVIDQVESDQLSQAVVAAAVQLGADVAPGHVAVLAPRSMLEEIRQGFDRAGVEVVDPRSFGGPGLSAPLVLLAVDQANGLEFDAVVIVEPAEIAARGAERSVDGDEPTSRGLKTLYVAMTRPTKLLWIVGSRPFPIALPKRDYEAVGARG
jgi:DNA helicase IV